MVNVLHVVIVVFVFAIVAFAFLMFPMVNDVETGKSNAYPDLQPLILNMSRDAAFVLALETAQGMPGWTIVSQDQKGGIIVAQARTRVLGFIDDVTVSVSDSKGGAVVNMASRSRVGKSDLGANARRIRSYLEGLREKQSLGPKRI